MVAEAVELVLGSSIFTVGPVMAVPVATSGSLKSPAVAVIPSMAGVGIGGQMAIVCCWGEAVDESGDSGL